MALGERLLLSEVNLPRLAICPDKVAQQEIALPLRAIQFDHVNVVNAYVYDRLSNEDMAAGVLRIAAVLVSDSLDGSTDSSMEVPAVTPIAMSRIGFAHNSGTAVLPMCSISHPSSDSASVSQARSSRKAFAHSRL
jgi:hypothetical protein